MPLVDDIVDSFGSNDTPQPGNVVYSGLDSNTGNPHYNMLKDRSSFGSADNSQPYTLDREEQLLPTSARQNHSDESDDYITVEITVEPHHNIISKCAAKQFAENKRLSVTISPNEENVQDNRFKRRLASLEFSKLSEEMSGVSIGETEKQSSYEVVVEILKRPQFERLSRKIRLETTKPGLEDTVDMAIPEAVNNGSQDPTTSVDMNEAAKDTEPHDNQPSNILESTHTTDSDEQDNENQHSSVPCTRPIEDPVADTSATISQAKAPPVMGLPLIDVLATRAPLAEAQAVDAKVSDVETVDPQTPDLQVDDAQMEESKDDVVGDSHIPCSPLDELQSDSTLSDVDFLMALDDDYELDVLQTPKTPTPFRPDDPFDNICMQLPDPETVCSPDFDHRYLKGNAFEPAHTLIVPRKEKTHAQAIYEYRSGSFPIPEDPSLWLWFQRKKYERWTELYPVCKRVTVQLVQQMSNCIHTNHLGQPQCRQCIKRSAGVACGFASIRYITLLAIELVDGTTAKRYLVCPVFRSEIEKAPAVRQPITPIALPGRYVVENDNSWIEFHILCMTSSSIKSLLRRELAVVRDVQVSEARGFSNGAISFYDSATAPQAVFNENDNVVHPIYRCSPSPCILRKARVGKHRSCYRCSALIFSAHFACCVCMEMICVNCFADWDDSDIIEHFYIKEKGTRGKAAARTEGQMDSLSEISHCKRFVHTEDEKSVFYSTRHRRSQFIRVSHFTEAELEMMLCKTNRIVQYCDLLDESQPAGYSSISLCSNELKLDDPEKTVDYSWTSSRLDKIDLDTEIIAKLGDADFGADPTLRPTSLDSYSPRLGDGGAGPSRSHSWLLETEWDEKLRTQLVQRHTSGEPWQTTPVRVSAGQLTLREFARLWEESRVIVVEGLLDGIETSDFTPGHLASTLGKLLIPVCKASTRQQLNENWTLEHFLHLFSKAMSKTHPSDKDGKLADRKKKIETASLRASINLRNIVDGLEKTINDTTSANEMDDTLTTPKKRQRRASTARKKGVPRAAENNTSASQDDKDTQENNSELVRQLKLLSEQLKGIVPFEEYTSPMGQLNLINRLPKQFKKPNIGPEIHFEYGRLMSGSQENMRCEGFDMVNVVLYASDSSDMLPSTSRKSDATEAIRLKPRSRSRIAKNHAEKDEQQNFAHLEQQRAAEWDIFPPSALDLLRNFLGERSEDYELKESAIHNQDIYLDADQRRELFRRGGDDSRSCRVYQCPGDAVFVPSGSMYQRRVFRNTVSLQSGFVSPERMVSTRQLSSEISGLRGHSRRNDALPVMDILWWTWMGNETDRQNSASEVMKVSKTGGPKQNMRRTTRGIRESSGATPSTKRRR
ncbi:Lysine-specific demethylase 3B [Coemansia sp. RSA 1200]|nr:Lysine-specific demethylase 3B [Coemansia sp. RSA 1200]